MAYESYIFGVILAILSGVFNNLGMLLEKMSINDVRENVPNKEFRKNLLRRKKWWSGFILSFGISTIFSMSATSIIGPTLTPGLNATGLIILAIGSVKIIGESLNKSEIFGVSLMVFAGFFLGYSEFDITSDDINFNDVGLIIRIAIFTMILFVLWLVTHLLSKRKEKNRGKITAFSNGAPFSLSNFWMSPLLATIALVFSGTSQFNELIIFIFACFILVFTNLFGVAQTQMSFKYGQVSNAVPIQQVTVQITPIIVYFLVFAKTPPSNFQTLLMLGGVICIIVSGFLLSKRQAELEK
ncbi:MAG: hypothetical protein GY870_00785 [archaeon]|nr:hypothetical protein [archaeon]